MQAYLPPRRATHPPPPLHGATQRKPRPRFDPPSSAGSSPAPGGGTSPSRHTPGGTHGSAKSPAQGLHTPPSGMAPRPHTPAAKHTRPARTSHGRRAAAPPPRPAPHAPPTVVTSTTHRGRPDASMDRHVEPSPHVGPPPAHSSPATVSLRGAAEPNGPVPKRHTPPMHCAPEWRPDSQVAAPPVTHGLPAATDGAEQTVWGGRPAAAAGVTGATAPCATAPGSSRHVTTPAPPNQELCPAQLPAHPRSHGSDARAGRQAPTPDGQAGTEKPRASTAARGHAAPPPVGPSAHTPRKHRVPATLQRAPAPTAPTHRRPVSAPPVTGSIETQPVGGQGASSAKRSPCGDTWWGGGDTGRRGSLGGGGCLPPPTAAVGSGECPHRRRRRRRHCRRAHAAAWRRR
ncbi:hypothetical protein BU14_0223s0021 [Porphyra umbilicalis]|uniref:Uncharacterized protein n=1 Tax=Porphyra umbilicalis TaxID=2786 RepID=A0A1X6P4I0_PORUM|nr:hypothetical protein BU14_0223s0021 [Porphyra umbilicalis]|eukprot:OSX75748.1 hypothetical protein BU14_0223s0021 [Porphyra umbilicalis]